MSTLSKIVLALTTYCCALTASALEFDLPENGNVVGHVFTATTVYEDTFLDVARKYDVAYDELVAANPGVDVWIPGEGTTVTIPQRFVLPPGEHKGIVINLAERRLYYFPSGEQKVYTFPIAIGLEATPTPITQGKVIEKEKDPTWHVPASIYAKHLAEGNPVPHSVPPGPDNPLGQFALRLSIPGYLVHGTNRPVSVGQRMSNGCIRLYPEDIERLFGVAVVGDSVRIINQPYKVGQDQSGELYLEAHPLPQEWSKSAVNTNDYAAALINNHAEFKSFKINWKAVKRVVEDSNGMPGTIGRSAATISEK